MIYKGKILFTKGWYGIENWRSTTSQWVSNNATILMNSEKNMSINLSFDIMSFYKPRNLDVYLNDKLIYEQQVQTNFSHVNTQTQLNNGTNIIRFYTKDGCKRPYDKN